LTINDYNITLAIMNENRGKFRPEPSFKTVVLYRTAEVLDVVARPSMALLTFLAAGYSTLSAVNSIDFLQGALSGSGMGAIAGYELARAKSYFFKRRTS
jgi:hypothetical protein